MPNYKNAVVYKIESPQTDKVYIGSTTLTLANRMCKHRHMYKSGKGNLTANEILKFDDAKILLIEKYPCNTKDELHTREAYWIKNLDTVNKVVPKQTDKEYREKNKEKLKANNKKWVEANKEKVADYKKEWYEKNKAEILQKAKDNYDADKKADYDKKRWEDKKEELKAKRNKKVPCDICGVMYSYTNMNKHKKAKHP